MVDRKKPLTFIIRGKPAVIVLVPIFAFFMWQLVTTHDTVDPEVEVALKKQLTAEYARSLLPLLKQNLSEQNEADLKAIINSFDGYSEKIEFSSLKYRGSRSRFVVRAEILVDGQPPPKGKSVRYFRFNHSSVLGYIFEMEVFVWEYYFPFFD